MLIFLGAQCGFAAEQLSVDVERIVQVELQESVAASPAQLPATWLDFSLPYQRPLDVVQAPYAWFRFSMAKPVSDELQSLYVNNHMFGVQVWMNGELVGGSMAPPGKEATGWNLPLLVPLPQGYWRDGDNEFLIRLELQRFTNVLASVFVGPDSELRPLWQQRQFWQGQMSLFSFYLCLIMGLFMLGLWVYRRHDTQYLWFGVSSLAWSVPMLYMAVDYSLIRHDWFLILTLIAVNIYSLCSIRFVHRLMDMHYPRLERWHLIAIVIVSLLQLFASASVLMPLTTLADTLSLLLLLNVVAISARLALQPGQHRARLIVLMAFAALLLFSHDVYEFFSVARSNTSVGSGTSMQYAFPIILLVFFLILIKRFV
ncbi:MAG: 7TM diverse intracellular signaling domain-containing protein, partial [Pseudomonadota bacterium]